MHDALKHFAEGIAEPILKELTRAQSWTHQLTQAILDEHEQQHIGVRIFQCPRATCRALCAVLGELTGDSVERQLEVSLRLVKR